MGQRLFPLVSTLSLLLLGPAAASAQVGGVWVPQGPGPNTNGQVENVPNGEVVGAVQSVAAHPTNADILYVAAANGGVWRTGDARSASPTWVALTSDQPSLSMGSIEFDPTDASAETLVAGFGRFSSLGRDGGSRPGILRTTDEGASWSLLDGGGTLVDKSVISVAPRGATLVVAVNAAGGGGDVGIFRSTNTGATFTLVSSATSEFGLPEGAALDLASDPENPATLYAAIRPLSTGGGLFRSDDTGATWTKISDGTIDALLQPNTSAAEIVVGPGASVFAGIVNGGSLNAVFHSDNGAPFTQMSLPGGTFGIHPGTQGSIHFSMAADTTDRNVVYVGGDRQDLSTFPNPIGAMDFSGNLSRGDVSLPAATQWQHLTHSNALGTAGGGTASSSSPHADSRDMIMDAAGELIETDDGGVYRRTSPRDNTGDWFSINGTLQTAEQHSSAYDSNSDVSVAGAQDTGTAYQIAPSNTTWASVLTADGGKVAINDTGTPGFSTRYVSFQGLGRFTRQVWDASGVLQSSTQPALTVLNGGNTIAPQFYTPVVVNAVDPLRVVIGAGNSVFESLDEADTVTEAGVGIATNGTFYSPIVYGNDGNADLLWVGDNAGGLHIRTAAPPAAFTLNATYPGGTINDIALDPEDSSRGFVIDSNQVFSTSDGGNSWTEITSDLAGTGFGSLRSMAYVPAPDGGAAILLGTREAGVLVAFESEGFANWQTFGEGLPRAVIYEIEWDATDQLISVGTLGRGTYHMSGELFGEVPFFSDDFESGNTSAWGLTSP